MRQIIINLEDEDYLKIEYTADRLGENLGEFSEYCLKLGFLKMLDIL